MSDFHHDSNVPRSGFDELRPYEKRVQWAAVGVLLLLCAGIFAAALFSGDTQTAMNSPTAETTGSAANMPAPPPQLRK
jgi:hypothetical protein